MKHKGTILLDKMNLAYIFALVIFVLSSIMMSFFVDSNTMDIAFFRIIRYVSIFIALTKICFCDLKKYSLKKILLICSVMAILIISSIVSSNRMLVWTAIMVIAAYGVDFRRMLKNIYVWEGLLVILIIFLALIGLTTDRLYFRGEQVRHSLGFKYSTYAPLFLLTLSSIYLYLRKGNLKLIELITLYLLAILMYVLTDTRFEPALVVVLASVFYGYQKWGNEKWKKVIRKVITWIVPVALLVSALAVVAYDPNNSIWRKINSFTSDRLSLSSEVIKEYGVKAFGNSIEWVGLSRIYEGDNSNDEYNAVDNAYLKILVQFGALAMIIFVYAQLLLVCYSLGEKDYYLQMIVILFSIFSILNPHTYEIVFFPFILLINNKRWLLNSKSSNEKN